MLKLLNPPRSIKQYFDRIIELYPDHAEHNRKVFKSIEEKRLELLKVFPYSFYVEDITYNIDDICRQFIHFFGFNHGDCPYSNMDDYLCPDVDQDNEGMTQLYEHAKESGYLKDENTSFEDYVDNEMIRFSYEHSHIGNWCFVWHKKTGYDMGINEFFFKYKEDMEKAKSIYYMGIEYNVLF